MIDLYFQPYGDEQQLNLNWIINEIINLHKQLDPDYETPSFTQVYPYSNLNRLNLDWILSELKALKELAPEPTPAIDIQAVAEALVALPFDSNTSYQIYDFISRDGEIWRATEAIPAGGEWDSTKWFKTTLGQDLAVLERWINTINNSLSGEIEARQNADTTLQTNINNEALARQQADTSLQNAISGLTSANISDDSDAGGATVKASLNNLKGSLNTVETNLGGAVAVSTEAELLTTTKAIRTTANISLGNTGVTIEAYARGVVISNDGTTGCVLAVGYNGNVYAGYFANSVFVKAQVYDNRSTSITLTKNQTYISSTAGITCKRTGNIVAFSGTIVLGADAITDNILLSGFPAPSSALDIFGTVVEATDTTLRGKAGRFRIKTDGTLVPWYNTWGASMQGSTVAFNTSYII